MEKFKKEGACCNNCHYRNCFSEHVCDLKNIYIINPDKKQCPHHIFLKGVYVK